MATPAVPITVTTPAIHPSFWAKAATWFAHEASIVKKDILWFVGKSDVIAAEVQKIEPVLGAVSDLILPGSAKWEAHLIDVWAEVAAAVHTAGDAAAANGINVAIDAQLASQVRALIPTVQTYLHPSAGPTPPAPKA